MNRRTSGIKGARTTISEGGTPSASSDAISSAAQLVTRCEYLTVVKEIAWDPRPFPFAAEGDRPIARANWLPKLRTASELLNG